MNLHVRRGVPRYDSESGEDVGSFSIPDAGFINDVVLTRKAAYFTDSQVQRFYRVRIGRHGRLGEPQIIPITGDFVYTTGFNANGIEEELTDPLLDVPTTIAPFKRFIYAVNARFDRPDDSDDDIIRLRP